MRRTITPLLLVMSLVMVLMAPATASEGKGTPATASEEKGTPATASEGKGLTDETLENAGWTCVLVGVGSHCVKDGSNLDAVFGGDIPSLSVMVFSPDGQTFYGTETLRWDKRPGHESDPEPMKEHHWKAGIEPI